VSQRNSFALALSFGSDIVSAGAAGILAAQTAPVEWRRVGNPSMEVGLASPATGPVDTVWYSADGAQLYARTRSGRVLETTDFESWTPAQATSEPADAPAPAVDRVPEPGAKLALAPAAPGRIYALGTQLYRSDDGGHSWSNLTAFHSNRLSARRSAAWRFLPATRTNWRWPTTSASGARWMAACRGRG
jgi:hypothetical protein